MQFEGDIPLVGGGDCPDNRENRRASPLIIPRVSPVACDGFDFPGNSQPVAGDRANASRGRSYNQQELFDNNTLKPDVFRQLADQRPQIFDTSGRHKEIFVVDEFVWHGFFAQGHPVGPNLRMVVVQHAEAINLSLNSLEYSGVGIGRMFCEQRVKQILNLLR